MANTISRKSQVKVMNNTTGSLSFYGIDGKKYLFEKAGSYKLIDFAVIEGLFNEHETFITRGYIFFEDTKVYDTLDIPEEVYSKIIPINEIKALLEEKSDAELKEILSEAPDPIKENVATLAKKNGVDSRKKAKAIKEATGFDISEDEE
jgi:hypothetical protein